MPEDLDKARPLPPEAPALPALPERLQTPEAHFAALQEVLESDEPSLEDLQKQMTALGASVADAFLRRITNGELGLTETYNILTNLIR